MRKILSFAMLVILFLSTLPYEVKGAGSAEIKLDTTHSSIEEEKETVVTLDVNGIENVKGIETVITFDPNSLLVSEDDIQLKGPFNGNFLVKKLDKEKGEIIIASAVKEPVDGDIEFVEITFEAQKSGSTEVIAKGELVVFEDNSNQLVTLDEKKLVISITKQDRDNDNNDRPISNKPEPQQQSPAPVIDEDVLEDLGVTISGKPVVKTMNEVGGVVQSEGLTLQIPPDALTQERDISITKLQVEQSKKLSLKGTTLSFADEVYHFGPSGTSFGQPVTVSFPIPASSTDKEKLSVYHFNEKTEEWEQVRGVIDYASNTLRIRLSHFSIYAVLNNSITFADIQSHWAKKEIESIAAQGIVKGFTEDFYRPDHHLTRAQFTKMVVEMLNLPLEDSSTIPFRDVGADTWYATYVETAYKAGLVKGSNGKFNPNDSITRQQMTAILVRAVYQEELKTITQSEITDILSHFKDQDTISEYARSTVAIAMKHGLMHGRNDGTFAPLENSTRAHAAAIVYRYLYK